MPVAPYLLFGLDVAPNTPNRAAIITSVEDGFPITTGITSLGVANVFVVEVLPGSAPATLRTVSNYFVAQNHALGGQLRWFVQLSRSNEIAGN